MNKKLKDSYAKIKVPYELEKKVINKTVEQRRVNHFRFATIGITILLVSVLSVGIVKADEIKSLLKELVVMFDLGDEGSNKIKITDNLSAKKVLDTAPKTPGNGISMSFDEFEKAVGFEVLKLPENNPEEVHYFTSLNKDGSLASIYLWMPGFITGDKEVSASYSILNEGAEEGRVKAFLANEDAIPDKKVVKTYTSQNLGVKVVITSYIQNYWLDNTKDDAIETKNMLKAVFVYDDVIYDFFSADLTEDDFVNLIESLKK